MTLRRYKTLLTGVALIVSAYSTDIDPLESPAESFAAYCDKVRSDIVKLEQIIMGTRTDSSTFGQEQLKHVSYMELYRQWLKCVVGVPTYQP